jgi:hypothetical protein
MIHRSKMVSFRVSVEEFERLHEACRTNSIESVSGFARSALQHHIPTGHIMPLNEEIRSLCAKIDSLTSAVNRLSGLVEKTKTLPNRSDGSECFAQVLIPPGG